MLCLHHLVFRPCDIAMRPDRIAHRLTCKRSPPSIHLIRRPIFVLDLFMPTPYCLYALNLFCVPEGGRRPDLALCAITSHQLHLKKRMAKGQIGHTRAVKIFIRKGIASIAHSTQPRRTLDNLERLILSAECIRTHI